MTNFVLPTGIGATLRNPFATYVRMSETEWLCTEHVLDDILPDESREITNELMLGYKGAWEIVSEGVEL